MAKYKVDWKVLEDADMGTLIDAAARYLNVAEYPGIEEVLAILGIEEVKECVGTNANNAEQI